MTKPEGKGSQMALIPITYFSKKLHDAESPWLADSCSAGQAITCCYIHLEDLSLFSKGFHKRTLFLSQLNPLYSISHITEAFFSKLFHLTLFPPFRLLVKIFDAFYLPSHPPLFNHSKKKYIYIWHKMQIMKFHIMQFLTALHFFICLRFKRPPW